ncbi:parallel beta-helix domain-containing protein [Schlesneria paludicola]|uniref:parallel beta-helix domain-containing protein n=1 Tax=Schlesneria paludicola TaxID=360056 RepID=UPI000299FF2A|nr:parallel beta-helix domain-containing protein [Schlesneria paludicola]
MHKALLTRFVAFGCLAILAPSTRAADQRTESKTSITRISPSADAQYELQSALINSVPGDVIELAAGTYEFDTELNVVCDNFTIRGAGQDQTILSFKNQNSGSGGLTATGNAFVIEDLAVQDTVGNGIKVLGARDVTFRRVRVEWTAGPKPTNGAYGIYPVECRNVLIENSVSIGASDAGIYCGQCRDVVVKGCTARTNVTGIEIENTVNADVFDNLATDNTGGVLIFDLPGLNLVNGGGVRVFHNQIVDNNHENFAPLGTMVADVPAGTGVMLMATDQVEIFDNDIKGNQTSNVMIVSFLITERKLNDAKYDPYPEAFSIHDNRMSGGGKKPSGQLSALLTPLIGVPFPDIFYDGITDKRKLVDGKQPDSLRSAIRNNGDATFANVHVDDFTPANVLAGKYRVDRSLAPYNVEVAHLKPVALQPHAAPTGAGNPAVAVYRAAPKKLSEWKLFREVNGAFVAEPSLIPYELNTPLFSDYTAKHRTIRLPEGSRMTWTADAAFEFPVGTVIAKTFAYPDTKPDKTAGERYVETRIELREASGWYGYSYVWNDAQTDADLRLGGGSVDVSWKDADGTLKTNHYQIPNANQCIVCHGQDGKFVPLGPTAKNLNRTYHPGDHSDQITEWIKKGLLHDAPSDRSAKMAQYDNPTTGSVDDRARAWLDVNCAHCHNPVGSARTSGLDLRTAQLDPAKYGVFKSPVAAGKGSGGRRYDIIPGRPDESILMFRLETEEAGARMPSLARNMAHQQANELIREWIRAMPVQVANDR